MNLQGLHLVGLDWFGSRSSRDHLVQMRWLSSDLALVPSGYPVVLLSHGQPNGAFQQSLRRHAPRAIRVGGALHLSTAPGIVVGRDWSPPQVRLVEWDGDEFVSRTVLPAGSAPPRFRSSPPRWRFQTTVAPAASSLHLAPHPDGIVATTADHDRARGTVALLDARTGKVRWSWGSPQPVASAATVNAEGSVFVQTAGGMVLRVDDGRPTWMIEAADPAAWVTSTPVLTKDGGLITEGPGFVRCLGCTDGRVRWTRYVDDGDVQEIHPSGRICDDLAVLPLAGHSHGLTVLNPRDGAIFWCDSDGTRNPRSSPAPLGDGTALIVREGAVVERFDLSTGSVRWSTPLGRPASAATPAIIDELALVVTADAVIHILDSRTGWLLRDHRLQQGEDSSINKKATAQLASAAVTAGGLLHVITVGGQWWRLDPFHWEPVLVASLPVAVTGQPLEVDLNLVVPGREGVVLAASLETEDSRPNHLRKGLGVDGRIPRARTKSDRWLKSLKLSRT